MKAHATSDDLDSQSSVPVGGLTSKSPPSSNTRSPKTKIACAPRSLSFHPESPRMYSKSPSLPIRSPLKPREIVRPQRVQPSASNIEKTHSPTPHIEEQLPQLHAVIPSEKAELLRMSPPNGEQSKDIPPSSPPLVPTLRTLETPKRKRPHNIVDDDLPSSSPPHFLLPRFISPKRQKRQDPRSRPLEIASTPERSPRRPYLHPYVESEEESGEVTIISKDIELEPDPSEDEGEDLGETLLGRQASPTLSSPTRTIPNSQPTDHPDTQAVFKDPTQFIDFDIPDPDEGWDDDFDNNYTVIEPDPNSQLIDSPPPQPSGSPSVVLISETQPDLPNTQALFDTKTQLPDFSIAEPDGGWDALDTASSPPPLPRQDSSPPRAPDHYPSPPPAPPNATPANAASTKPPPPSPSSSQLKSTLDTWISKHLSAGYTVSNIISALKATSNDLELAKFVLRYMNRKGRGRIPSNEKGIWTEDDDEDLESPDARRIEKVQGKHGDEKCDVRLAFLGAYRQSEKKTTPK